MLEIWKDVKGYEGRYMVSQLGKVKSVPRYHSRKRRILSQTATKCGYLFVGLYDNGKSKIRNVHQLVAESFLGHTCNGHKIVVDHINNNKQDNRICNLQLITQRENTLKDSTGFSSKYAGVSWSKTSKKWIASIYLDGTPEYLGSFEYEPEASLAYDSRLDKFETLNIVDVQSHEWFNRFEEEYKNEVGICLDGVTSEVINYNHDRIFAY